MDKKRQRHYWNILTIAGIFSAGLWIPLHSVFLEVHPIWDVVLEVVFIVYFAIHYFYFKADEPKRNSWFYIDAIVALPVCAAFFIFAPEVEWAVFFLLAKLVLVRRVALIRRVVDAYDELHPVVARLIPIGLTMPLVVHFLACGWIFLDGGSLDTHPEWGLTQVYLRSVYWVITTLSTVGYGDISPVGLPQMMYANVTMIIGIGFFGFVLSNVASILARMDAAREKYLGSLDKIESYMRSNKIPAELRLQVREYYRYQWENHWGRNDEEAIQALPKKLRQNIAMHINREMIEKVPFFHGAQEELVVDIVSALKFRTVVPGEAVFRQGDLGESMFFIQSGKIDILSTDDEVLATLQPGSFFGEAALLTSNPRNATAQSQSYADIYVLERACFESVLAKYSDFKNYIHQISNERNAA